MKNTFLCIASILVFLFLGTHTAYSQAFRTTWITTDKEITIPTDKYFTYDYSITWKNLTNKKVGDGSTRNQKGDYTIGNLENGSTYEVAITGEFPHFDMKNKFSSDLYSLEAESEKDSTENVKLRTIEEWGKIKWKSMANAFEHCRYLTYKATDSPNLEEVKNMSFMFSNCEKFDGNATMNNWNTSNVTNMSSIFDYAGLFNQPIGKWNTKKVEYINSMFREATAFNQPIGEWNTEKVTDMAGMFQGASSFNQPIGKWNTEKVISISGMFSQATAFNQPIGKWNTEKVEYMGFTFEEATSFNQPIGEWNTENVTGISGMFRGARSFNQPIGKWNTEKIDNMYWMFDGASSFNQPIGEWNTENVTTMNEMFSGATHLTNLLENGMLQR